MKNKKKWNQQVHSKQFFLRVCSINTKPTITHNTGRTQAYLYASTFIIQNAKRIDSSIKNNNNYGISSFFQFPFSIRNIRGKLLNEERKNIL